MLFRKFPERTDNSRGSSCSRKARRQRKYVRKTRVGALRDWQETHEKPEIRLDGEEEAGLTALEKDILKALRAALDNNDFSFVNKAVELMKEAGNMVAANGEGKGNIKHWSVGVNKFLRQSAVEALGWFGSEALPELLEFAGDDDPDIDQFELAMQDVTLADYERAEIVKQAARLITNEDDLDWVLTEATNARPSVGADALLDIWENGTDMAKEMLPTYIELLTGYDNISTEADLRIWKEEHPDPDDAEEFWGPNPI